MAGATDLIQRALRELEAERQTVDQQISALKGALNGAATTALAGRRRVRRSMSAAARNAVSRRMKAYWAKRRAGKGAKARPKS